MYESLPTTPPRESTYASLSGLESYNSFNKPSSDNLGSFRDMAGPLVGDNGRRIEWAHSLADGVKQAKAEGKPLVCIFEEASCGWCKKLDGELAKPAANAVGGDAVFVKVRPSVDNDGQMLANSLGINSYPTVSIIDVGDSSFNERRRLTGYMSADEFAAAFQTGPRAQATTMMA